MFINNSLLKNETKPLTFTKKYEGKTDSRVMLCWSYIKKTPDLSYVEFMQLIEKKECIDYFNYFDTFFNCSILAMAAFTGNMDIVAGFIKNFGIELLNVGNRLDKTPLHYAAEAQRPHLAYHTTILLLEAGAEPDLLTRLIPEPSNDSSGNPNPHAGKFKSSSPLVNAILKGNVAVTIALLRTGANINLFQMQNLPHNSIAFRTLEEVKKSIATDNEKLFIMSRLDNGSPLAQVPLEVIGLILKHNFSDFKNLTDYLEQRSVLNMKVGQTKIC